VFQEVRLPRTKSIDRLPRPEVADERYSRRVDGVPAEHRLHAEPRRRRAAERDHRPADEIRPREARARLPAEQKESVAVVHRGEVDERRPSAIDELEAPHEAREGEIGRAVTERIDRAQRL
jgi:hypothetical protein